MKKYLLAFVMTISFAGLVNAQDKTDSTKQFLQITTVESVIGGGIGRSKLIITNPDASQEEADLENLFSMVGINFKNIKSNELKITQTLKNYTDKGWKLEQVIPLSLSPGQGSNGIFMTRYLFSKTGQK
ncbi:hypothetical protein HHL16_13980 [Pseudoflavitalea sp. G-6-1-2]|uniref:hypothetical protein n=1 Tax=Pseudoflavitalea sp. G-6-1-2 TaxID=2728841 RepID=UPI00146DA8F0|nr:hypothetical protein [Pseudoflavitalea sp. G-6-1-2]NML21994.1 hypothetical protein [Pseudoflavitalea sp. G-6-1-2]